MLYHRQMEKETHLPRAKVFDQIESSLRGLLGRVDYPARIWVKVQCVDWDSGDGIPSMEMSELLSRVRRQGAVGLVVTPAPASLDLEMVKDNFK
jgi:hypothetical protein